MNDNHDMDDEWKAYEFWSSMAYLACGMLGMACMAAAYWIQYEWHL